MKLLASPVGITLLSLSTLCVWLARSPGPTASAAGSVARLSSDDDLILNNAQEMLREGRATFRFDTFGDEQFWGGKLKLHQAVAGAANGGVGAGLSPQQALEVGL